MDELLGPRISVSIVTDLTTCFPFFFLRLPTPIKKMHIMCDVLISRAHNDARVFFNFHGQINLQFTYTPSPFAGASASLSHRSCFYP